MMRYLFPTLLAAMLLINLGPAEAAPPDGRWAASLYLGNGGVWRQRMAVDVRNDGEREALGESVSVALSALSGSVTPPTAEALRVTNETGTEMLYALSGPDGLTIRQGPVPAAAVLTLPAECPAKGTARYYVYFDNPLAWGVPDFLKAVGGVRNGGVEAGEDNNAAEWNHDANDDAHQTFWTAENPHSGKHCLKTVVTPGAEPTWIATRQSSIRIIGGAKYVMTAWVKAQDVEGQVGWYIHVGNDANSMLISPMPVGGPGTYDWKQLQVEFTAPAEATKADLGTVLRGTGTAWFDDVALETDAKTTLVATAGAVEKLPLREIDADGAKGWTMRAPVRVTNWEPAARRVLVAVNGIGQVARLQRNPQMALVRIMDGETELPHLAMGDALVFEAPLPASSICTYYLTFGPQVRGLRPAPLSYEKLLSGPLNLAKNQSFELGEKLPEEWPGGAEGEKPAGATLEVVAGGKYGTRCGKISVPADAKPAWTGWRQDVPVQPGRTYLYSAWLKGQDLKGGAQLHAHKRTETGEMSKDNPYVGAGPGISGTADWTQIGGLFTMGEDCRIFQLHLTMNTNGTVWHDGVVLAEAERGEMGTLQGRAVSKLEVWPVPAVVKVFREDVSPSGSVAPPTGTQPTGYALQLARNEKEPLQIAVRGPKALAGVQVVAEAPVKGGKALPKPEVAVVGYVPIDYPTSYYSSDTPEWVRKFPTNQPACDGFTGWWPDPLLPRAQFDLQPNQTQPVWVTVTAPADAEPGEYKGTVALKQGAQTLWQGAYTVRVRGFTLPNEGHLAAIYDARQGGGIWQVPGKAPQQTLQDFWKFMADRRTCPDRIQPEPSISYKDGKVTADFTAYDKAATYYFDVLKLPHSYTPGVFYLFGWGHPPYEKFGEQPYEGEYPFEGVDRSKLRPEYKRAYQACLKAYWDHVKEKGWADKIVLYISDEPYNNHDYILTQMKALCDMIHEVDPSIRIYCSNWSEQPEWENGYVDVWGAGHYGCFSVDKMKKLQADGDTIWYTTDGQMCTDTPYCGVERLLPHYAFKYGARAYEFWGVDWLTYDPYQYGWHAYIYQSGEPGQFTWVRYPNGDGFLAYPGKPIGYPGAVTSVRLEQAREGMEDYEYLWLLRDLVGKTQDPAKKRAGEAALREAEALVEIPNAGGRYSTKILAEPEMIYQLKAKIADSIEALAN